MTTSSEVPKEASLRLKLVITVVLLVGLAIGGYCTYRGLLSLEVALDSNNWPTTPGEITRSTVRVSISKKRENGREVPNQDSRSYAPEIEYRYTVDNRELTGTRVSVEDASLGTKASAQNIADEYPVGAAVTVSYRAEDPEESVLKAGDWIGTYRWFLPGGVLVFLPLLILRAIWLSRPDATPQDVQNDENHPARSHLLYGLLMMEEVLQWQPGETVHLRRARVGILKSLFAAVISGLMCGLLLGLLPAVWFLSGKGAVFVAQVYLVVSALIAVPFAVGLLLYGRRREYLLDWPLRSIRWEIGWSAREAPLESIERLVVKLPAKDSPRNPVVDSHRIQACIQGRNRTLLETNGNGLTWSQTRDRLVKLARDLSEALQVPWTESHDRPLK